MSNLKSSKGTRYYIMRGQYILVASEDWEHEKFVGPGGSFSAKTWKTRRGAERWLAERPGLVKHHGATVEEFAG
jgi:hypothetical protein